MKLEVVEFYLKEKKDDGFVRGETKIRLHDLSITLSCVYVARRTNGKWLILLPCHSIFDSKTGDKVKSPIVLFEDAFHRELMSELYATVPSFVEQKLNDTANSLISPAKKTDQTNRTIGEAAAKPNHKNAPSGAPNQSSHARVASDTPKTAREPAKPKVFIDLPPKAKSLVKREK